MTKYSLRSKENRRRQGQGTMFQLLVQAKEYNQFIILRKSLCKQSAHHSSTQVKNQKWQPSARNMETGRSLGPKGWVALPI